MMNVTIYLVVLKGGKASEHSFVQTRGYFNAKIMSTVDSVVSKI